MGEHPLKIIENGFDLRRGGKSGCEILKCQMSRADPIRRHVIALFFASIALIGCVTPSQERRQVSKPESYEIILCKNIKYIPIEEGEFKGKNTLAVEDETDEFIMGDGQRVFVVPHWFDLVPNTDYTFKFEWHKPDGRLLGMKQAKKHVIHHDWYTPHSIRVDPKYNHPSGLWSVKVYVNDEYISAREFLLGKNEDELARLKAQRATNYPEETLTKESLKADAVADKASLSPTGSAQLQFSGRRLAVVIGISEYKYLNRGGLTNLIYADDDARSFAEILTRLGWERSNINLLINDQATERNIRIALESWLTKAGADDQIVLFWAGHGFPDPEDPEKVYFACYDTDIQIPATGYRMDRVRAALEERGARNVMVFADTCHAGKLITRGDRGLSIIPNINKMHREDRTPKGWIFMVGADTDRKAVEHTSWTNGAFTHCLLQALSGEADGYLSSGANDGVVTMGELRAYMNTAMPDETQRVLGAAKRPVIATSAGDPDIWNLTLQVK